MRRLRDESGQMMTALVIGLAFTLLAVVVVAVVPVGAATNEKTRSQTAADAAALAGAQAVRERWVDEDTAPGRLFYDDDPGRGGGVGLHLGVLRGDGRLAAADYARLNDATLERYEVVPGQGEVEATVENTYQAYEDRGRARSSATAEFRTDIDFRSCRWEGRLPTDPTIESTPPGPPTFTATLTCGDWEADYVVVNSSVALFKVQGYAVGLTRKALYDDLEPRLVD